MNKININDKIELTVLQLHYLLEDAMVTLCRRYAKRQDVKPSIIAGEIVREFLKRRKEQNND